MHVPKARSTRQLELLDPPVQCFNNFLKILLQPFRIGPVGLRNFLHKRLLSIFKVKHRRLQQPRNFLYEMHEHDEASLSRIFADEVGRRQVEHDGSGLGSDGLDERSLAGSLWTFLRRDGGEKQTKLIWLRRSIQRKLSNAYQQLKST